MDIDNAKAWATAEDECGVLEQRLTQAKSEADKARYKMEVAAEKLLKTVGPNAPLRVFNIGDGTVLIVDFKNGIKRVKAEAA